MENVTSEGISSKKVADVKNNECDPSDNTVNHPKEDLCWTRKQILKNLVVVSCAFLLLFTAYEGVAILQSTMNSGEGVGVLSQATIYVFFCFSALFLPKYVITKLGCKSTLILSMLTYCPYVASNFYHHWSTMIPTAAVLGLGASLLWSSKSTYINELSSLYCAHGHEKIESVTARFFGFSGTIFMSTHLWGNLMSFYILERDYSDLAFKNNTTASCGSTFCSSEREVEQNPYLSEPTDKQRFLLSSLFVLLSILAVVMTIFFLDSLPRDQKQKPKEKVKTRELLASTVKLMVNVNQLLLMPLAFYVGLAESFYIGDYTMGYVACTWGIYHVGIVTISNGVACAISSSLAGLLVKYLGRPIIFVSSALINVAVYVLLFAWTPDSGHPMMMFVVSSLWGFFVGVFWIQIRALYGFLFKSDEEAGFANYYLWNSLGFCLSFAYSKYLCMATKTYIASAILAAAMLLYAILEIKLIWGRRNYRVNVE